MNNIKSGLIKIKLPVACDEATRKKIDNQMNNTSEYVHYCYYNEADAMMEEPAIITLYWTQEKLDECIATIKKEQATKEVIK